MRKSNWWADHELFDPVVAVVTQLTAEWVLTPRQDSVVLVQDWDTVMHCQARRDVRALDINHTHARRSTLCIKRVEEAHSVTRNLLLLQETNRLGRMTSHGEVRRERVFDKCSRNLGKRTPAKV